jgi:hypothetical protein
MLPDTAFNKKWRQCIKEDKKLVEAIETRRPYDDAVVRGLAGNITMLISISEEQQEKVPSAGPRRHAA